MLNQKVKGREKRRQKDRRKKEKLVNRKKPVEIGKKDLYQSLVAFGSGDRPC